MSQPSLRGAQRMRGISEARLLKLREHFDKPYSIVEAKLVQDLINECKELNPWLPIDENTPKYKELLLYYPENDSSERLCRVTKYDPNSIRQPTHYQELPDDPKE